MKTEKVLLVGAGILGFLWFIGIKAVAAANLTFYPWGIESMAFVGNIPTVVFTLQVQNTSSTPLTINSLAGNILSNGTLIGNIYNFSPVVIPPNGMAILPVTAQLQPLTIVNDIVRAFQQSNFTQNMGIDGVANVQGLQVPVKLSFSVGLAA